MLEEFPHDSTSWLFVGIFYKIKGNFFKAREALAKSLTINPKYGEAYRHLAIVNQKEGKNNKAIEFASLSVKFNPKSSIAYDTLGTCFKSSNDYLRAEESYKKALSFSPNTPTILNNLGITQRELGNYNESITSLKKANELLPDKIEIIINLALSFVDAKQNDQARQLVNYSLNKEIFDKKNLASSYSNYGYIYYKLFEFEKAISSFNKALEDDCDNITSLTGLAEINSALGNNDLALKYFKKAFELNNNLDNSSNYFMYLSYHNLVSGEDILKLTSAYFKKRGKNSKQFKIRNKRDKIRVGFISYDLNEHPVSHFFINPLKNLDRNLFDVFIYYTNNKNDKITSKIKGFSNYWRDLKNLNNTQKFNIIKKDDLDILIDLSGHTAGNSLGVLEKNPSPIQILWLGYSSTTGLKQIDYIICDSISIPKKEELFYIEKPLRMKDSYYCFSKPYDKDLEIKPYENINNNFRFGNFSNSKKINMEVVETWSKILNSCKRSELHLMSRFYSDYLVKNQIIDRFKFFGISEERIFFYNHLDRKRYLESYNNVDLMLDTFPYPGGTTTCESLYMGTPVLVLKGFNFLSRNGENIMANSNLNNFIAKDRDNYVKKAIYFYKNRKKIDKNVIRKTFFNSSLLNAKSFSKNLENILIETYNAHYSGRSND